jgi:hypothetical protein
MFFLDATMDAVAAILLLFSIIKLLIVIFFFSFLCLYYRHRQKHPEISSNSMNDSSRWRHSSSFDSSSSDNLPKKNLISSPIINHDDRENDYIEKRRVILNDYDSHLPNKRVQSAAMILPGLTQLNTNLSTPSFEQQAARKLSSISERTEKTETDDSEPDLLRIKHYNPKRKAIITPAHQKQPPPRPPPLPKKLPTIKNRRRVVRDEDNDSGILF